MLQLLQQLGRQGRPVLQAAQMGWLLRLVRLLVMGQEQWLIMKMLQAALLYWLCEAAGWYWLGPMWMFQHAQLACQRGIVL